jgi:hypothetical protein
MNVLCLCDCCCSDLLVPRESSSRPCSCDFICILTAVARVLFVQELRPDTIRGRYGVDRPRSAVHCTDLPQDGTPECEYCFRVMV